MRAADLAHLSADQARAIANIAASPYLVQPLQAPAGAGKTHSLQALRAAAHRTGKEVLVLAPTGKAVDEAMRDQAGDHGLTVAKALKLIEDNQLQVDHWRRLYGADLRGARKLLAADRDRSLHAHTDDQAQHTDDRSGKQHWRYGRANSRRPLVGSE